MSRPHSMTEVFVAFLKLGLTSFGGPVAHLGYFRAEFVEKRRWLSDGDYAGLVALCQFLPGPASSQVGFALGLMRAGWGGALAAFVAFTLPSALALLAFALGAAALGGPVGAGIITGLKIVAVAIVAQAVLGMARSLCPDGPRASIAAGAVVVLALLAGPLGMVAAIGAGALAGMVALRDAPAPSTLTLPVTRTTGAVALGLFAAGMVGLPLLASGGAGFALVDSFWRAGALVFGGGHVVLPLLQAELVPSPISTDAFLAGYGAAQAVPGPLFTFAAYLGALSGLAPVAGAALALVAIFAPGFLLLVGVLPWWQGLQQRGDMRRAVAGANAAVVGVLGAALYDPILTSAVTDLRSFALALVCFVALIAWRAPSWAVVIVAGLGGVVLQAL